MVIFDVKKFAEALDAARFKRRIAWKDVALEAGVSASTLCRIIMNKHPNADSLARLITWLKQPFENFISQSRSEKG